MRQSGKLKAARLLHHLAKRLFLEMKDMTKTRLHLLQLETQDSLVFRGHFNEENAFGLQQVLQALELE